MAVTPDDSTLIIAESFAGRLSAFDIAADGGLGNRRVWAELGEGGDGICLDAEGAVWTPAMKSCLRVREGGEVLERLELDRFGFACMLGGPDGRTLFVMAADWGGTENIGKGPRTGQVLTTEAPAPHAGRP
jgi:sugar lactone lactonase YvrE